MKFRKFTFTDEENARLIKMHLAGKTLGQIALVLGRKSKTTIFHQVGLLREAGVLPPRQPKPVKASPRVQPIQIGTFEDPLVEDERHTAFLDALRASENLPANVAVREGRAVVARLSTPLSVSCVGSPAQTCSEN